MKPEPAVLQSCLLFRGKSADEIGILLQNLVYTVTAYRKNAIILAEGDTADRLGILLSGRVEVQKTHSTGSSVTIAHLREGQTIGEAVLFRRENIAPATVTATGPCKVMFIGRQELLRMFAADTDILTSFIENPVRAAGACEPEDREPLCRAAAQAGHRLSAGAGRTANL